MKGLTPITRSIEGKSKVTRAPELIFEMICGRKIRLVKKRKVELRKMKMENIRKMRPKTDKRRYKYSFVVRLVGRL